MQSKILLLLSLLIVISSCGEDSQNYETPYVQDSITFEPSPSSNSSYDQFTNYIDKASISPDTPEGLGLMIIKRNNSSYNPSLATCTWFHIGEDLAMTNSHCIPDILKRNHSLNCSKYIGGVFKTQSGTSKNRCKKVLYYSHIESEYGPKAEKKNPDYAIIKLDAPLETSTHFHISRDGFDANEETFSHTIKTMRLGGETLLGRYKRNHCISVRDSVVGNFYEQRSSLIPLFSTPNSKLSEQCNILSGNSGSPTVSQSDPRKVKGIVFASTDGKSMELEGAHVDPFAILTSFACLHLPEVQLPQRDSDCDNFLKQEKENYQAFVQEKGEMTKEKIKNDILQYGKDLPKSFRYVVMANKDKIFFYTLKCMMPLDMWSAEDLGKIEEKSILFFARKTFKAEIPILPLEFEVGFDKYGVLQLDVNKNEFSPGYFYIDNLKSVNEHTKKVGKYLDYPPTRGRYPERTEDYDLELRLCHEDEYDLPIEL